MCEKKKFAPTEKPRFTQEEIQELIRFRLLYEIGGMHLVATLSNKRDKKEKNHE